MAYGFSIAEMRANYENQINDLERQRWLRRLDLRGQLAILNRLEASKFTSVKSNSGQAQIEKMSAKGAILGLKTEIEKLGLRLTVLKRELAALPEDDTETAEDVLSDDALDLDGLPDSFDEQMGEDEA